MRIGIDAMGGDFAPEAVVLGAKLAFDSLPSEIKLVLIGDENEIISILNREGIDPLDFDIVHASEVIEMGEHPAKTFSKKMDSSISIGFRLLKCHEIDGFASAGNTGAVLVGTMFHVPPVSGIIRPCITAPLPKEDGSMAILLDVGINPDCKPEVLYQYAILGSLYAENVYNIKNPKVGLLNIGSEPEKGNLLTKATHELMKSTIDFNFIGNIEGNDLFKVNIADVIVCDGFTGNIVLKGAEAIYSLIKRRNINDAFFDRFNPDIYGGTPVLGIDSTVVIGHGASKPKAIKNMILHTKGVIEAELSKKIKQALHQ